MSWIQTFTRKKFSYDAIASNDICIEDIAHALSMQCRFNGHVSQFYSVAQHSVHVSQALSSLGHSSATRLAGLLHDAHEAYLGDIPTPLKKMMFAQFDALQKQIDSLILQYVGLAEHASSIQWDVIHRTDTSMLVTEASQLLKQPLVDNWISEYGAPLSWRIVPWAPAVAENEFMFLFNELREDLE